MSTKTKGFGPIQVAEMLATARGLLSQVETELVSNLVEAARPITSTQELIDGSMAKPIKEQLCEVVSMNGDIVDQLQRSTGYIEKLAEQMNIAMTNVTRDQETALEDLKRLTSQAKAADPAGN